MDSPAAPSGADPARGRVSLVVLTAVLLWFLPAWPVQAEDPLPDQTSFLREVRRHLRSNRLLLSQYTFTQKRETHYLDKQGRIKRGESKTWEVYPGGEESQTFRRLVSQNGQPVSQRKKQKQDRRWEQQRKKSESARGQQRLARAREKEERALAEVFELFSFELGAREVVDGYPTIRVRFEPRPEYRPRLKDVRQLKKIRGVAWIHEPDFQLVRLEAELLQPISFGWGLLAKLRKGARLEFSRRLINDEIWLPYQSRVQASARVLFKGLRLDSTDSYSNFQKFSVETTVKFDSQ